MGMPKIGAERWTVERVLALPNDGNRYELIDGELLVSPSPIFSHQRVVLELVFLLRPWVEGQGIGTTAMAPADLQLEQGSLVQPDVFVIPQDAGDVHKLEWIDIKGLLLAIEVLSPSTARNDRVKKRALFSRVGVPEYWIFDTKRRRVERYRPGVDIPELCDRTLAWHPEGTAGAREPLVIDLPHFFHLVLGS